MKTKTSVIARLHAEEQVCRKTAAQHGKDALRLIAEKKFSLAVTTLIEAEVEQSEADVLKRAAGWVKEGSPKGR